MDFYELCAICNSTNFVVKFVINQSKTIALNKKRGYAMRKLLLSTTALAAAATLSANTVLADVSISGAMEWTYESFDRGSAILGAGSQIFFTIFLLLDLYFFFVSFLDIFDLL